MEKSSILSKLKEIATIVWPVLLVGLGGRVEVPFGNVPFILSDFFVFLFALQFSGWRSIYSISLFLLLGILGVPLFAGGASGIEVWSSPTAGYLLGYLAGTLFIVLVKKTYPSPLLLLLYTFIAYYLLFVCGLAILYFHLDKDFALTWESGFYPFIFSMHFKALIANVFYQAWKWHYKKETTT